MALIKPLCSSKLHIWTFFFFMKKISSCGSDVTTLLPDPNVFKVAEAYKDFSVDIALRNWLTQHLGKFRKAVFTLDLFF